MNVACTVTGETMLRMTCCVITVKVELPSARAAST